MWNSDEIKSLSIKLNKIIDTIQVANLLKFKDKIQIDDWRNRPSEISNYQDSCVSHFLKKGSEEFIIYLRDYRGDNKSYYNKFDIEVDIMRLYNLDDSQIPSTLAIMHILHELGHIDQMITNLKSPLKLSYIDSVLENALMLKLGRRPRSQKDFNDNIYRFTFTEMYANQFMYKYFILIYNIFKEEGWI